MSGLNTKPLTGMPSVRMKQLTEVFQSPLIGKLPSAAARVWTVLAVGYAGKDGRCWPSRQLIEKNTGLKRASVTAAISSLEKAGWLERLARPKPGRTSEFRVLIPSLECDQNNGTKQGQDIGPITSQQGQRTGSMRPVDQSNAASELAPEQESVTELQQQQNAAAEIPTSNDPPPEHPAVAAGLDRVGMDATGRLEICAIEGIEMVIDDLVRRTEKAHNPPGLLRALVRSEAAGMIAAKKGRLADLKHRNDDKAVKRDAHIRKIGEQWAGLTGEQREEATREAIKSLRPVDRDDEAQVANAAQWKAYRQGWIDRPTPE